MLFLILAIVSSTGVSIALRLSRDHEHSLYGKLVCNYLACMVCSFIHTSLFSWNHSTFVLGTINGFLLVAGLLFMQLSMQHNGIALTSLYGRLGVSVPLLLSMFLFGEMPTWFQTIGIILAFVSIIMLFYQSRISFQLGFILILFMLISGLGDTMSKIYQFYGVQNLSGQYLLISFFIAALLSFLFMLFKRQTIALSDILYGLMIGIPNYYSSYFLLHSLNELPAIAVYPTYALTTIVTISICGYIFFKEKIHKEMILTTILIMISIGLLNL